MNDDRRQGHAVTGGRQLSMGVKVTKANGSDTYGLVAEQQLEHHGWGTDPLAAIEAFRAEMGWPNDLEIRVVTDEDSGYPTVGFRVVVDAGVATTRPQKALRLLAQQLLDAANGIESELEGSYRRGSLKLIREWQLPQPGYEATVTEVDDG